MRTSFATISKQGARSNNEDYLLVMDRPEAKRLTGIVCDGMGGHSCGEVASLTVCNCIAHYWEQHTALPDSPEKVLEACREASAAMDRKAAEEGITEMGTTLVMASIEADSVTIAHVGDSRCYVQRPGDGLIYQTEDHKVNVNGRQMLARCFFAGHPEAARPDIKSIRLQAGDRILLCSDGLYGAIGRGILRGKMMDNKPLEKILDEYDKMCERDGNDNYSAILIELA